MRVCRLGLPGRDVMSGRPADGGDVIIVCCGAAGTVFCRQAISVRSPECPRNCQTMLLYFVITDLRCLFRLSTRLLIMLSMLNTLFCPAAHIHCLSQAWPKFYSDPAFSAVLLLLKTLAISAMAAARWFRLEYPLHVTSYRTVFA